MNLITELCLHNITCREVVSIHQYKNFKLHVGSAGGKRKTNEGTGITVGTPYQ